MRDRSPIRLPAPRQIAGYAPREAAEPGALERLEAENAELRKIASAVMSEIDALRGGLVCGVKVVKLGKQPVPQGRRLIGGKNGLRRAGRQRRSAPAGRRRTGVSRRGEPGLASAAAVPPLVSACPFGFFPSGPVE